MITRTYMSCSTIYSFLKNKKTKAITPSTALLDQNFLAIRIEENKNISQEDVQKLLPGLKQQAEIAQQETKSNLESADRINGVLESLDAEKNTRRNRIINAAILGELVGFGLPLIGALTNQGVLIFLGVFAAIGSVVTDIHCVCHINSETFNNNDSEIDFFNSTSPETVNIVRNTCGDIDADDNDNLINLEDHLNAKRNELEVKANENINQLTEIQKTIPISMWFHTIFAPKTGFPTPIAEIILQYADESYEKPIIDGQNWNILL